MGFKARVALEAVKGERTVSELAAGYGVQPLNRQAVKGVVQTAKPKFTGSVGDHGAKEAELPLH